MTPGISKKLRATILVVAIAGMSAGLYVTPTGQHLGDDVRRVLPFVPDPAPAPRTEARKPAERAAVETVSLKLSAPSPSPTPGPTPSGTPAPTVGAPRGPQGCWDFAFQQDAQAVYAADLSDPLGLDGPRGPENGDGLACLHLPIDPSRPGSAPVGAYVAPIVNLATHAELVVPKRKYFGVSEDGIPGDTKLMDKLARQVGKAPSMIQWFSTWDEPFTADKVAKSWARGALPVITWMPAHKGNKNPADTSLKRISEGAWDDYVRTYAEAVVAKGLPVVIRMGHEQNGNWYPWSAGGNRAFERGDRDEPFFNTPQQFIDSWRRVHDIFAQAGANDLVIWTWAPVRVDGINPNTTDTSKASYGLTAIADSYPGDEYVDWVGLSAYAYKGSNWSYEDTFSRSFEQLRAVAPGKPILVAETGASENSGPQPNLYRKPVWITDTLAGLANHPSVVGFVWFNNTVVDVHTIDGVKVTTDNKWDTSVGALQAFVEGIADPIWLTGVGPDPISSSEARSSVPVGTP